MVVVAAGKSYSLAICADGVLWSWGTNSYGQLGISTNVQSTTPQQLSFPNPIRCVETGMGHNIAIDESNKVWCWGWNKFNQLGVRKQERVVLSPICINLPSKCGNIVHISCDAYSSVLLDDSGRVYGLGIRRDNEKITLLSNKKFPKFVQICNYTDYFVAMTKEGEVFSWGKSMFLGFKGESEIEFPRQIEELSNICKISAGSKFTFALEEEGTVWAWGNNSKGNLGLNHQYHQLTPTIIPDLPPIAFIASKGQRSFFIDYSGGLWCCGSNYKSGLGLQVDPIIHPDIIQPAQIQDVPPFKSIAVGLNHVVALDLHSNLWTWGINYCGELGRSFDSDIDHIPTMIDIPFQMGNTNSFCATIKNARKTNDRLLQQITV